MSLETLVYRPSLLLKQLHLKVKRIPKGVQEKSIGRPDAVTPHVLSDERGVKTEHVGDIEAPADERAGSR
jgi:hypothetical protein